MKKWLFAILLGSALVLGACGGDNDGKGNNAVETSAAEESYEKSCMQCHGGNLNDGSAPDLTAIGSKYSADEIAEIIENGTGGMPPITNISDDDRTELADWLAAKK